MIIELTDETFDQYITTENVPVIYVYKDSCEMCNTVTSIVDEVQYEFDNPFYKMNADKCPETIKRLRIRVVPLIMVFLDGKMRQFVVGEHINIRSTRVAIRTINNIYREQQNKAG